jgi:MATE family multidrug resistance protein
MSATRRETHALVALALPIIGANIGTMLMGTVDTLMVGHVGEEALAASSLGNAWIMATLLLAMGIIFGVDPIVTQAHGAGDGARAGRALQSGIVVALLVSIPLGISWWMTEPALRLALASPEQAHLAALAQDYVRVQIPCLPFFLVFTAMRQYLQGRGIVRPALAVILVANLVNLFGNWVLIYGRLGLPALGLVGSGVATALTRIFMLVALTALFLRGRLYEGAWVAWSRRALAPRSLLAVLRYGLPTAAQMVLEIWAFATTTVFSARLGATAAAAHAIVLNMASISFMVPLGVSGAAVTRIGNLIGANDRASAQRAAWCAFALGAGAMSMFGLVFASLRSVLPRLYTTEATVALAAAAILPIAAAFQVFDGLQVVGAGILRGMGRTLPAAWFNLAAYYALALPLGWWLAFERDMGLAGLWWGLATGLAIVGLCLVAWVHRRGPARGRVA